MLQYVVCIKLIQIEMCKKNRMLIVPILSVFKLLLFVNFLICFVLFCLTFKSFLWLHKVLFIDLK